METPRLFWNSPNLRIPTFVLLLDVPLVQQSEAQFGSSDNFGHGTFAPTAISYNFR
jgi:hypothetical protein